MACNKKQLSGVKGWVTRSLKNAKVILSEAQAPLVSLESEKANLLKRWERYESYYSEYELHMLSDPDTDIDDDTKAFQETELEVNSILLKLDMALESKNKLPNKKSDTSSSNNSGTLGIKCKMPEIKLPEFYGEPEKWESFWNTFRATVHEKDEIPIITKFSYLLGCCKGTAKSSIESFELTEEYYEDAINILKANFACPKRIKRAIIQKWLNLKSPAYNAKEMLEFKIIIQSTIRQFSKYQPLNNYSFLFEEMIQSKLPHKALEFIQKLQVTQYPDTDQILEGLQMLSDSLKHQPVQNATGKSKEFKPFNPNLKNGQQPKNFIGSYQASQNKCIFCQKFDHTATSCKQFPNVETKRKILSDQNRCTRCMYKGHKYKECPTTLKPCTKCGKDNHHTALCYSSGNCKPPTQKQKEKSNHKSDKEIKFEKSEVKHTATIQSNTSCLSVTALPTAIAEVESTVKDRVSTCRIFFDQGSQHSFISSSLSSQLQLKKIEDVTINLKAFRHTPVLEKTYVVEAILRLGKKACKINLLVVDDLDTVFYTPSLADTVDFLKIKGIKLADPCIDSDRVDNIEVLIGGDYYSNFISGNSKQFGVNLLNSPGGKLIFGPIAQSSGEGDCSSMHVTVMRIGSDVSPLEVNSAVEEGTEEIHKLWDLDTIGINPQEIKPEDKWTYQSYLESVQYNNGQYWVRLPFKINSPPLPTNYRVAVGQLFSLLQNLKRKPEFLSHYHNVMQEQLQMKFIEEVPSEELKTSSCHYIPHHGVEKKSVTTPVRIVFNCSSKAYKNGPSLNDCLMTGPSLTERLGDVLLRFRLHKYAYTADISKAFLRVGLQSCHRDYTRFLWVDDPFAVDPQLKTYRFMSVLFGAKCSPFLLQATLAKHFENSESSLKAEISANFYVDNFQGSTDDETHLAFLYSEANAVLAKAGMPLQSWNTNELNLQQVIDKEETYDRPVMVSVLGLMWQTEQDSISIKPVNFKDKGALTRRKLLSQVSALFDPLGLLTPITIRGKMLMQQAWQTSNDWDEYLPSEIVDKWKIIKCDFESAHTISFPRSVAVSGVPSQLHIFADASSTAFGAVAYLVQRDGCYVFCSKSRVAPLPTRSIPQMELTALQVAVYLAKYIKDKTNLDFQHIIVWSDNEPALQWIRNNQSNIPYVRNRVNDIRVHLSNFKLFHVPSKENPADLLSRGTTIKGLTKSTLWFNGPDWLVTGNWPSQKEAVVCFEILTSEHNKSCTPILPYGNYSSLAKLLKVTSYVIRFLRMKLDYACEYNSLQYWLHFLQRQNFPNIISILTSDKLRQVGTKEAKVMIRDLGLFLDDKGILRCHGRIGNANLPRSTRYPILLPAKHHITDLIIENAHISALHEGVQGTLAQLRSAYWVPKGRQAVKTVLQRCMICKRFEGCSYKYPGPPPLPSERVTLLSPFNTVGIDYTGAIEISNTDDGLPRKYYILLFTCTASRAIHLELAEDLSTQTFLLCLRRFCAYRSYPKKLISDNAKSFHAANKFLQSLKNENLVEQFLESHHIEWLFIAPYAPWQGGFYERLVGIVKGCLRKVLHRKKTNAEELRTLLAEIQTRVNNRPLTYLHEDLQSVEPLTPSHLLTGRRIQTMPLLAAESSYDEPYMDSTALRVQTKLMSRVLKHFENTWASDYLTSLREKYYGAKAPTELNAIKKGDLVFVQLDCARKDWPLGRVVSMHDHHPIRVVDVFCKGKVSSYTVEKLIPLEVDGPQDTEVSEVSDDQLVEISGELGVSRRPKRHAAMKADLLRLKLLQNEQL